MTIDEEDQAESLDMDDNIDFELDADGVSMDAGTPQTIRKNISLNLKRPKSRTKSSTKGSKSKKDKKERNVVDDSDPKSLRRSKTSIYDRKRDFSKVDDRDNEKLDWSHEICIVGEKLPGSMIHVCEKCLLPIVLYGRVTPCKHVFCYSCAEKGSGQCHRCMDPVERIEAANIGHIFVCTFGGTRNGVDGCRRSYLSQRDLISHIKHRHQRDGIAMPDADLKQQQPMAFQFISHPQSLMIASPSLTIHQVGQPGQSRNPVLIAGLSASARPAFVTNRLPHPSFSAPPQPGQYSLQAQGMQLSQPALQGAAFLSHSQSVPYPTLAGRIPVSQASAQGQITGSLSSVPAPGIGPGSSMPQSGLRIQGQRPGDLSWAAAQPMSSQQDWPTLLGRTANYPTSY